MSPSKTLVPLCTCACGATLDAASGRPGAEPSPGDLSICIECGNVSAFGPGLRLLPVDLEHLDMDPMQKAQLRRVQAAIQARRPS